MNVFDIDSRLDARAAHHRGRRRDAHARRPVLAFAGAALALRGSTAARPLLIAAALAGVVTAMALWIPAGVVIGAAAVMLGQLDGARDATPAHRAWGAQRVLALAARSGHDALCDRRQAPRDRDGEGTITVAP